MYAACRAAGFPDPVISYEETGLWVNFPFSRTYRDLIEGRGPRPAQNDSTEVTTEVTMGVTTEVGLLQALASGAGASLSLQALQQLLGLHNDEHFRKAYLLPALASGRHSCRAAWQARGDGDLQQPAANSGGRRDDDRGR